MSHGVANIDMWNIQRPAQTENEISSQFEAIDGADGGETRLIWTWLNRELEIAAKANNNRALSIYSFIRVNFKTTVFS